MQFQQISMPTIKEVFMKTIEEKILSGELSIGQKLPSERELASQMKISKTVVHEGLKELERIGFVEAVSNRGTFVADYLASASIETLNAIIHYNNDNLDEKTQASMIELRLAVEPEVLIIFAQRAGKEEFEGLTERLEQIRSIPRDTQHMKEMAEAMYQYHFYMMVKSGNNIFPILYHVFVDLSVLIMRKYIEQYGSERMLQCVETIHGLLLERKGEEAARLLKEEVYQYGKDVSLDLHEVFHS